MTDDDLIEAMARAIAEKDRELDFWEDYLPAARAALAVAKRELIERCAKEAENECWDAEAHPESIYGSTCLKIAARIRKIADD